MAATPAQADARFGLALWLLILLLGSVGAAVLIWPEAGGWISSGRDSMAAPFVRLFESYCPAALQPMALKGASVFLSPWLYLLMALAFWLTLVLESYSRIYHSNLRTNYGPLRYVLVTPQSHRIHHSIEPRHADKNFAVLFSFWDRLFGTQWTNYDEYPETGVDDDRFPHEQSVRGFRVITNYLLQLAYPFQMIWSGSRGSLDAGTRRADCEESI